MVRMWAKEVEANAAAGAGASTTVLVDDVMPRCILDIVGAAEYGLEFNSLDAAHHPILEVRPRHAAHASLLRLKRGIEEHERRPRSTGRLTLTGGCCARPPARCR